MRGLLGGQAFGEIVLRVKIRTGRDSVQRNKKAGPTLRLECEPSEQNSTEIFLLPSPAQLLPPQQHHLQDHPPFLLFIALARSAFAPFQSVVFFLLLQ